MRLLRLTGLSAAVLLVVALLPLAGASATTQPTAGRSGNPVASGSTPAAAQALTAVQAAFAGTGQPAGRRLTPDRQATDVTMLLLNLRRHLDGLSPQDRRTADRYFARPTDGNEPFGASYGPRARPTSDCAMRPHHTPRFCVHWARRTSDAPAMTDSDGDGIPNQVEKTRRIVGHVWRREVTLGGYRAPLKDGNRGGNGKLDVYLADIGGAGVYGYCVNERRVTGRAFNGYCVLDNDYSHREFPSNTPGQNLKVTAAHEFFHAVQFAYDAYEDPWFMESTATWMEDQVYDGINDNRFYLVNSPITKPALSLDYDQGSLHVYGDWIFWRYLTERFPDTGGTGLPLLVRQTWEAADAATPPPDLYSLKALDQVLTARGASLAQLYGDFSAANRYPASFYEEGAAYPSAPMSHSAYTLSAASPKVDDTATIDHLSSNTLVFKRDSADSGARHVKLTVGADTSSHQPAVRAIVVHTDGSSDAPVTVNLTSGTGTVTLPYDSGVQQVELVLANGGHGFRPCWAGTDWSCSGKPLDENLKFSYTATRLTS